MVILRGGHIGVDVIVRGGDDNSDNKCGVSSVLIGTGTGYKTAISANNDSQTGINYGISVAGNTYAGFFYGNVSYTGTLTGPSDRKFKENIKSYSGALNKLMKVDVNTFNYIQKRGEAALLYLPEKNQIGFIAQQLEEVFPNLVKDEIGVRNIIDENTGAIKETKKIEYKGVNYIGMIPILTKAIQEQQEIIEDLKIQNIQNIENLQRQIDELKAKQGATK